MRLSTKLLAGLSLIVCLQHLPGVGISIAFAQTSASIAGASENGAAVNTPASTKVMAGSPAAAAAAARGAKAKHKKPKGDDFDGDRSLNMFQLEPTVINERYYTSGQAEHHQKISPTLPYGAPIPDNEGPYAAPAQQTAPVSGGKPQTTGSADLKNDKLDSQVLDRLSSLESIKNDSPALKLKLRVSTIDGDLVAHLKALKVDVISSAPASGDMVVYAPARNVSDLGNLKEVLMVVLAQ
ncbi:MAG: hypothetical protein KGS72_24110 [Cyanobacteria bacterium REEB67]|nr:hypothetical protein [Cyanobacteria bacterium REEB67]